MSKTGKITIIQDTTRTWESQSGLIYFFSITFDNGDQGEIGSKSNPPAYKIGDEMEYTIEPNGNFPNKVKKVNQNSGAFKGGGGGFKRPEDPNKHLTMILSYAKDLGVARIGAGGIKSVTAESIAKDFNTLMDAYDARVPTVPVPAPAPVVEKKAEPVNEKPLTVVKDDKKDDEVKFEDLPF